MIEYSEINENDLKQIIDLYETYLNSGEYIINSIKEAFETENYLGFKACDGDRIVGFFSGQEGMAFTYPHPELEKEISDFAGSKKIYNPDALFLHEEYRNKGIAKELIRRMKDKILEKNMQLVIVELWIYPNNTVPAKKPLEMFGEIVFQKEVPSFYKDLHKYGVKCPLCGDKCNCGALIIVFNLDNW